MTERLPWPGLWIGMQAELLPCGLRHAEAGGCRHPGGPITARYPPFWAAIGPDRDRLGCAQSWPIWAACDRLPTLTHADGASKQEFRRLWDEH